MIFSTGSQPGAGLETVGSGVVVVNSGVVIVGLGVVTGSAVVGAVLETVCADVVVGSGVVVVSSVVVVVGSDVVVGSVGSAGGQPAGGSGHSSK